MESQLRGVSSGQPQLFAEIAQSHDLRAPPEQLLRCFFSPVLGGHKLELGGCVANYSPWRNALVQ
jgi:hypothetical protein